MTITSTDYYVKLEDVFPYSMSHKLASKFSRYSKDVYLIQLDVIFTPYDVVYKVTRESDVVLETAHIQRAIDEYNTL